MAKDAYHNIIRTALEKDGWLITNDPLYLPKDYAGSRLEIDLGAEKIIVAERGLEKIAVEVKSFLKTSMINELHGVVGQYLNYFLGLKRVEPDRTLYVALPQNVYEKLEELPLLSDLKAEIDFKLITFDIDNQVIISWIK